MSVFGTEANKRMLHRATNRILQGPVSFFDTTPLGRIMNRFSKDVDIMGNNLSEAMRVAATSCAIVISVYDLCSNTFLVQSARAVHLLAPEPHMSASLPHYFVQTGTC